MATQMVGRIRSIHYAWIVVAAAFVALLIAMGVRSTFAVYLKPLQYEFNTDRATISLVASLSILINGIIQPIIGYLLDRMGARAVVVACLLITALGLISTAFATEFWQIYISFGLVVSGAAGGPSTVMGTVVASRWFVKHRGLVIGILNASYSAGQVVMIPLAMQLNLDYGWRTSYLIFGLATAVMVLPIGLLIRSDPSHIGKRPFGEGELSGDALQRIGSSKGKRTPISGAMRTHGFWMMALGFFVCGYTTAGLISTHFVALTVERGFESMVAAAALGVLGLVSAAGTIVAGTITDRYGCKNPLALIYAVRGLALVFLLTVDDPLKLNVFAVVAGLSFSATVPPTSTLTAKLFGRLSVGAIFGVIFMSHQIGGALGSYVTGRIFDLTGSYQYGLILGAALCFVAAVLSFSIKEQPLPKPSPATV